MQECQCDVEEDNYCYLCCGNSHHQCLSAHHHSILRYQRAFLCCVNQRGDTPSWAKGANINYELHSGGEHLKQLTRPGIARFMDKKSLVNQARSPF